MLNCCLGKWPKYHQVRIQRSVCNSSVEIKNSSLKQLLKKSLKIASLTFGVTLLGFGGYALGWILCIATIMFKFKFLNLTIMGYYSNLGNPAILEVL